MRRSKYNAIKTVVDGIEFDSKKEARRYQELKLLEKAGIVSELWLQVPYPLNALGGKKIGKYICDFDYLENGKPVIEDVKGYKNDFYKWKKKHFEAQYGIKIRET